jgi:signal transduction histidine kinase
MYGASEGINGADTTRILQYPDLIRQQYIGMIRSARSEILMILPTVNAVQREYNIGVIGELKTAVSRGVRTRLLSAEDDFVRDKLEELRGSGVIVRRIETPTETKFKMLSVDRRFSLVVETKDDSRKNFADAVGVAIFSSSKTTVSPFVTIFETLWRETDLYEKTQQAEKIKDEFVNIAAHELRNPIMPLTSGIEIITENVEMIKHKLSPEEYQEIRSNLQIVIRNIDRLTRLTDDILQVSRIESGAFELNVKDVDIDSLVGSVITDVKKKYADKMDSIKIIYGKHSRLLVLMCDESKVEQCLYNLIDNALKFTAEGRVSIQVTESPEDVTFQVSDTGAGIDPEIKTRLFEKFASKSDGGTGLGLYVTKRIVLAHGGSISGSSNDGPGATFTFSLPRNLSSEFYDAPGPVPANPEIPDSASPAYSS